MIPSVLYVSRRTQPMGAQKPAVDAMVACAQERSRLLDVTGALICSRQHFAQYLEGPEAAVQELMTSIERDPLHHDVVRFAPSPTPSRRFSDWSLAYSKSSAYVENKLRSLAALNDRAHQLDEADRVLSMMRVLVDEQQGYPSIRATGIDGAPAPRDIISGLPREGSYDEATNLDVAKAISLMRGAIVHLDEAGASIAAAHLDLAICTAESFAAEALPTTH